MTIDADALARSVVDTARTIFRAKAASISELMLDTREFEFVAVAGEGRDALPGVRFPATKGIAGWVLRARQSVTVEDVRSDPRFALDVAEQSGYVPEGLMAVPLLSGDDEPLGVLQVLDRPERPAFAVAETKLLGLLGQQAIAAIELRRLARRGAAAAGGGRETALPGDAALAAVVRLQDALGVIGDPAARADVAAAVDAVAALAERAGRG